MKRLLPAVVIATILGAALLSGYWQQYQRFLQSPLEIPASGFILKVERGTTIRTVISQLESIGIRRPAWQWRVLNKLEPVTIKAGEYELESGTLPQQLLGLLAAGKVLGYRFTIVEGWTLKQLLENLANDPVLENIIGSPAELSAIDGLPPGLAEGWFLPETYVFTRGDSDLDILRRAYLDMQKTLLEAWSSRATGLPYENNYELLIMASIVERETSLNTERQTIAGVFVRRLLQRWRLETDPTVIYGIGDAYDGDIRRKDLRTDTPYNTYTRHGLPPTPIAMPGKASIVAAAHPADGEAMFFVADGQGGHTFSATLQDHNRAVQEMLARNKKQQP